MLPMNQYDIKRAERTDGERPNAAGTLVVFFAGLLAFAFIVSCLALSRGAP
jgi:hypothetical protein